MRRASDVIFTFCVLQSWRLLDSDLVTRIVNEEMFWCCTNTTNRLEYIASLSLSFAGME